MSERKNGIKMAASTLAIVGLLVVAWGFTFGYSRRMPSGPTPSNFNGIQFNDVAADRGLKFRWNEKPHRPLRTLDAMGCGAAFFDFDEDGFQDILLVNEPTCGLFRNDGGNRFTDVTKLAGLESVRGAWKGCAVADVDGDGWRDLLLTGYHRLALLHNRKGEGFTDITRAARLDPNNWNDWASSAGFMDLDRDGDLELIVQNYVIWGPGVRQYCTYAGIQTGCPPKVYDPEHCRFFRNDGKGRFTDITRASGFGSTTGVGLVVAFSDSDNDGLTDVYLGNDAVDADFMHNQGGLKFRNVAMENGTMYGKANKSLAAMGVDWADVNGDGWLDFSVTDFSHSSYALFQNDGSGIFTDISAMVGLAAPTYDPLGFGLKFGDVDNDGWPDLFIVNGHVYDRVAETNPGLKFRQPCMLFRNEGGRHLTDLVPTLGGDLARPILGRGSASGDWDNDGRIDFLVVDLEGEPLLLHNESRTANHWIKLDLRSRGANVHAYGARVALTAGALRGIAEVSPASSYLSSSDPRLHFGLGSANRVDKLSIRWPSGKKEELKDLPVDQVLTVTEGHGYTSATPGSHQTTDGSE